MAPSATVPIAYQLVPPLLKVLPHPPRCPALAVLPTTAMPAKPSPSTSLNWPPKIVLTVWPGRATVSSATAASVPSPSVGASFSAVMVRMTVADRESARPSLTLEDEAVEAGEVGRRRVAERAVGIERKGGGVCRAAHQDRQIGGSPSASLA